MYKYFLPALFVVLITIGTSGCSYAKSSNNDISSDHSQTAASALSSNSSVLPPSSNESESSYNFSDTEI